MQVIKELNAVCVLHGPTERGYCPACDQEASIERDPFTNREVSAEERRTKILDVLRTEGGLTHDQAMRALAAIENPNTGRVSDDQLHRVLDAVQGGRVTKQADVKQETPADAAQALRDAGWSEDRIAEAVKGQ